MTLFEGKAHGGGTRHAIARPFGKPKPGMRYRALCGVAVTSDGREFKKDEKSCKGCVKVWSGAPEDLSNLLRI